MRRDRSRTTMLVGSVVVATIAAGAGPAPGAGAAVQPGGSMAAVSRGPAAAVDDGRAVGRWTVEPLSRRVYQLTWTSPTALPVSDARPRIVARNKVQSGPTRVAADGRSVATTVRSAARPDPADFDVELSGDLLDRAGDQRRSVEAPEVPYTAPRGVDGLHADPGTSGLHVTRTHDYTLAPQKLPDIPLKAEMVGHVVEPADATDSSPLVLFLHGRHQACYTPAAAASASNPTALSRTVAAAPARAWRCPGGSIPVPSYLGYDYAQRQLASRGYVTVSISADAINDLDYNAPDGGATARAALIEEHLDAWTRMVGTGREHADLSNVVLVGHSRGGEGANRASVDISADAPYTISGQVLIGPTDFGFQSAPTIPTVTILPYCDGDVSDLQGQNFTDAARDLAPGRLALHSSLLVMGANHNYFNTEWTPGISAAPSGDDWGGIPTKTCGVRSDMRLSPLGQRKVGKSYISAAVALFARDNQKVLPLFDGSQVSLPSADNADVRSHAIGGGLQVRRPRLDTTLSTPVGATTRFCVGQSDTDRPRLCEPGASSTRSPHWPSSFFSGVLLRSEFEMRWTAAGQAGGMILDRPWDLSGQRRLDLRTIVHPGHPADLDVRLTDSQGRSVTLDHQGSALLPLPGGDYSLNKRWGQTLRVSLAHPGAVDLTDITGVDLVSVNAVGRVWVVDMSAEPRGRLPAARPTPFPTISFGKVTQPEGDGPGTATVDIPYTVKGAALQRDATINVVAGEPFSGAGSPTRVTIPAHTVHGTLPVTYRPNDVDDVPRLRLALTAYPVRGLQTDRYVGWATILDDDPSPRVRLTVDARRIVEGAEAGWNLTLSAPVGYYAYIDVVPVRAGVPGPQLTVGDLRKRYRERHLSPIPPLGTPLPRSGLSLFTVLRPGRTALHITLPTARDARDEGDRSATLRFRTSELQLTRHTATVVVTDPS